MCQVAEPVNLGVALFVAYRALEDCAYRAATDAGGTMTLAQSRLAARVGPSGTRLTDLAAQAQVTKQTAAHLVNEMERSGYVERVPDPNDGRARLVRLTVKAQPIIAAANAAVNDELARWRTHLGSNRMHDLEQILGELREITDPWM